MARNNPARSSEIDAPGQTAATSQVDGADSSSSSPDNDATEAVLSSSSTTTPGTARSTRDAADQSEAAEHFHRRRRRFQDSPTTQRVAGVIGFPAVVGFPTVHQNRRFLDSPPTQGVAGEVGFPAVHQHRLDASPISSGDSSTASAQSIPSPQDAEGGAEPSRRWRFLDSPRTGTVSWAVWTAGLEGGISASDRRALELLVGQLHRRLGPGAAAPGSWRFSFEYDPAALFWSLSIQHEERLVASWRANVELSAILHAGARASTARGAHAQVSFALDCSLAVLFGNPGPV